MALPERCEKCNRLAEEPDVEVHVKHGSGVLCVGCTAKLGGIARASEWLRKELKGEEHEA